ncbi:MAG: hypothetical protein ACFFE8_09785 [Candidatus Heimdallarchaeota archaeon]
MTLPKVHHFGNRNAQMFILATMLIAIYVIAMTMVLVNYGGTRIAVDREGLVEPYNDVKRELQQFLELTLADYTMDGSVTTNDSAMAEIEAFLSDFEDFNSVQEVFISLRLNPITFRLIGNRPPFSNVSDDKVYVSEIFAEFDLEMNSLQPSASIIETFNISFIARAEVKGNSVYVQQSSGTQFVFQEAFSIYILNGTTPIFPVSNSDHSGVYLFPSVPNLDNIGLLNVTFPNGVRVFS